MPEKSRIQCIAPINPNKKTLKELASSFLQQGFSRVLADNKPYSLADLHENDFEKIPQKFEIIVDRIIIREGIRTRISEALDACLKLTHHKIEIDCENERIIYSTLPICKNGHTPETFLIPEAKDFSPYSHNGSCATCKGTELSEDESICETCNGLRLKTYLLNTTTKFGNYKDIIGKNVILPLMNRPIPVVADEYVERDFGTGVVKITPAHDPNDYEVGLRHNLPVLNVMNDDATINKEYGTDFTWEELKEFFDSALSNKLDAKVDSKTKLIIVGEIQKHGSEIKKALQGHKPIHLKLDDDIAEYEVNKVLQYYKKDIKKLLED